LHRAEIEAYFTRQQRVSLKLEPIDDWHYRIVRPAEEIDDTPEKAAFILSAQGWSTSAVARAMRSSWNRANRLIRDGYDKVEQEVKLKLERNTQ